MRWILSELKRQDFDNWLRNYPFPAAQAPECESIVDEGDHRPDEEEGEGDWEGAGVEAVHHGAP